MSTSANDPTPPSVNGPVDFALAPALRVRLLGTGLVALGSVVVVGVLVTWLTGLPTAFVVGLLALAVIGVVTLGVLVGLRHWVLRLDADGYRVRMLHPEARSARWSDVLDLQAATTGDRRSVVLRLRDGRTTALPVDLFEGTPARLTDALTEHLDRGHGYRRLS